MKLKTFLIIGIIALGLTSCGTMGKSKYGCPPSRISHKKFTA